MLFVTLEDGSGTIEILGKFNKELLFKGTDPESMAGLILSYLNNPDKPRSIREKARQFAVDSCSWDKRTAKTEELFLDIA